MHRHGHTAAKLSREIGPRQALLRGLVTSLILHERLNTTETKAKAIRPLFEKLVTKAKKGDLHNLRQLKAYLLTENASRKLVQELAPQWKDRSGGYVRIHKLGPRLGDNAPMAIISLILPESRKTEEREQKSEDLKKGESRLKTQDSKLKASAKKLTANSSKLEAKGAKK